MFKTMLYTLSLSVSASAAEPIVQQDSGDIARLVMQEEARRRAAQTQAIKEQATTNAGTAATGASNSINPSALMGQGSQNQGKSANDAAGTALMAAGAAMMSSPYTMPAGVVLMALGQLAKKQADHDGNAAAQSGATFTASGISGATGANTTGTSTATAAHPTDPTGQSGYEDPKIAAALKKFTDAGYKVTDAGLIHPNGKLTPASAFNTPASMAAAGLDARGIKEAQKVLDVINQELGKTGKLAQMSIATDGGGGGSSGPSDNDSHSGESAPVFNAFGLGVAQKKALIAGKTVLFDGEPIGVAGNDIFEMVHMAYQKRRLGNQFIETEVANGSGGGAGMSPASVRRPANVPNR
jgi:hypothetical protein